MNLDIGPGVGGAQDPPDVLHDTALEREREREEQVSSDGLSNPSPRYDPVANKSWPDGASSALSCSITAARAFFPNPPLSTNGARPLCSSIAASASRCSVHCVSTSTLRPSLTAADTSLAIWRVRAPSVTSARNTSWIAAISPFPAVQRVS